MQSQPLVTVKKASAALGLDKEVIRERLGSGEMKGEKRRVGDKDKWFIYHDELESWLARQNATEITDRLSTEGMTEFFGESEVLLEQEVDRNLDPASMTASTQEFIESLDADTAQTLLDTMAIQKTAEPQLADATVKNTSAPAAFRSFHFYDSKHLVQTEDRYLTQIIEQFADRLAREQNKNARLELTTKMAGENIQSLKRVISSLSDELNIIKAEIELKNLEVAKLEAQIKPLPENTGFFASIWRRLFV